MIKINPKEIKGSWDQGYVLDVHTISSTMIGYNEFGHPEFDTLRSELGEMVYRLKYKGDKGVIAPVVEAIADLLEIGAFILTQLSRCRHLNEPQFPACDGNCTGVG